MLSKAQTEKIFRYSFKSGIICQELLTKKGLKTLNASNSQKTQLRLLAMKVLWTDDDINRFMLNSIHSTK